MTEQIKIEMLGDRINQWHDWMIEARAAVGRADQLDLFITDADGYKSLADYATECQDIHHGLQLHMEHILRPESNVYRSLPCDHCRQEGTERIIRINHTAGPSYGRVICDCEGPHFDTDRQMQNCRGLNGIGGTGFFA